MLFVTHDVLEAVLLSNRVLMMSSNGEIYRDIEIKLPYPRLQTDHEVVTLQADILELFELMEAESGRNNGGSPELEGTRSELEAPG